MFADPKTGDDDILSVITQPSYSCLLLCIDVSVGCALGDFSGPIIAIVCFEKLHLQI